MAGELPATGLLDLLPSQAQGQALRSTRFCQEVFGDPFLFSERGGGAPFPNVLALACNAQSGSTGAAILTSRLMATEGPARIEEMREAVLNNPITNRQASVWNEDDANVFGHWASFAWGLQNFGASAFADVKQFFAEKWRAWFEGAPDPGPEPQELANVRGLVGESLDVLGAPIFATKRGFDRTFGPPTIVGFGLFPAGEDGLA